MKKFLSTLAVIAVSTTAAVAAPTFETPQAEASYYKNIYLSYKYQAEWLTEQHKNMVDKLKEQANASDLEIAELKAEHKQKMDDLKAEYNDKIADLGVTIASLEQDLSMTEYELGHWKGEAGTYKGLYNQYYTSSITNGEEAKLWKSKAEWHSKERKKYRQWWLDRKTYSNKLAKEVKALEKKTVALDKQNALIDAVKDGTAYKHFGEKYVDTTSNWYKASLERDKTLDVKIDFDKKDWISDTRKVDWFTISGDTYSYTVDTDFWIDEGAKWDLEVAFKEIADQSYDVGYEDGWNDGYETGYNDGQLDIINKLDNMK